MANFRPMLLISLVFLGYLLWVEWQKDYGPQPRRATVEQAAAGPADLVPPAALPADEGSYNFV